MMKGQALDTYDIQRDARHARKTFMEAHAVEQYGGKVFWVDADTVTFEDIPEGFLDELLPDDKLCCYLGRGNWFYTESGFIGFNANHPRCRQLMEAMKNVFKTGLIFTQPAWHDCIAFDLIRQQMDADLFVDLAAGQPHGTMHPQANSVLGKYMHHLKGLRKNEGRLRDDDIVRAAAE